MAKQANVSLEEGYLEPEAPRHVAIIMDGNGRWAKAKGLPRTSGHKRGAETLRTVLDACRDQGVSYLTIYAFSSENWKRSPEEVSDLMQLLKLYLKKELAKLHKNNVRLRFIGDRTLLSEDLQHLIGDAEVLTKDNMQFNLTVALSYGAREELLRAVRRLTQQAAEGILHPSKINEQTIASMLDTAALPDPDLLIRTGGEQRLSNFLLWQSAYTELYFTPVLWPDFNEQHFAEAIGEFGKRERRYGNA